MGWRCRNVLCWTGKDGCAGGGGSRFISAPVEMRYARLPIGSVGQGHFREVEGGLDSGFAGFAEELDVFLVGGEDGVAGGGLLCKIENDGGDRARVFGLAAGDAL